MAHQVIHRTREQLYDEVWSTPMRILASKFGLSDVGLAKVCRRHNIPRPPVGYWAKKAVGKAPARTRLQAEHDPRQSGPIVIYPSNNDRVSENGAYDPHVSALLEGEQRVQPIIVPTTLRNPHRLIVSTQAYWRAWEKHERIDKPYAINSLPDPKRKNVLDIDISIDVESRALRVMQAWLTALEARQFAIHINDEANKDTTSVAILRERFIFRLRERLRQVPHDPKRAKREGQFYVRPPPWDLVPTGDLELIIQFTSSYRIRAWKDSKREPLDSLLNQIIVWMIHQVGRVRAERAADERRRLEREERERQRRDAEERRRLEQEREDSLIQQSEDWEASRRLRAYLTELRAKAVPSTLGEPTSEAHEPTDWFEWAEGVANRLDPIWRLQNRRDWKDT